MFDNHRAMTSVYIVPGVPFPTIVFNSSSERLGERVAAVTIPPSWPCWRTARITCDRTFVLVELEGERLRFDVDKFSKQAPYIINVSAAGRCERQIKALLQ